MKEVASSPALDEFLKNLVRSHAEETIAFRRQLHMFPELSQQEFQTTSMIATRLEVADLPVRINPSRVGLLSDIAAAAPNDHAEPRHARR